MIEQKKEVDNPGSGDQRGFLSVLKGVKVRMPLKTPSSLPFLSEKKRLSLSIEGTTLRILACEGRSVTNWANIPLNPTLLRNGFISKPKEMAQVIKNAFKGKNLSHKKVIASLPGYQSLFRIITLPKTREVNPKVVLPGEASRLMSISMENNFLSWQAIEGEETKQSFFVLAVPKQPLLNLVETLLLAGLRPTKIDISPLALARAVNHSDAIIASAESNSIDIVIVRNHIPLVMRSVFLGNDPFPLESISPRVIDELGRTIGYYNDNNQDNPLPPHLLVYLGGVCTIDPDLPSAIQREVGFPVEEVKTLLNCPPEFPTAQMMVNIGLMLKEL